MTAITYLIGASRSQHIPHRPDSHRSVRDLRHANAPTGYAAEIALFVLSRRIGTSLRQFDDAEEHCASERGECG